MIAIDFKKAVCIFKAPAEQNVYSQYNMFFLLAPAERYLSFLIDENMSPRWGSCEKQIDFYKYVAPLGLTL